MNLPIWMYIHAQSCLKGDISVPRGATVGISVACRTRLFLTCFLLASQPIKAQMPEKNACFINQRDSF